MASSFLHHSNSLPCPRRPLECSYVNTFSDAKQYKGFIMTSALWWTFLCYKNGAAIICGLKVEFSSARKCIPSSVAELWLLQGLQPHTLLVWLLAVVQCCLQVHFLPSRPPTSNSLSRCHEHTAAAASCNVQSIYLVWVPCVINYQSQAFVGECGFDCCCQLLTAGYHWLHKQNIEFSSVTLLATCVQLFI